MFVLLVSSPPTKILIDHLLEQEMPSLHWQDGQKILLDGTGLSLTHEMEYVFCASIFMSSTYWRSIGKVHFFTRVTHQIFEGGTHGLLEFSVLQTE